MARRPISEEERALWDSVAKTAKPLKRRRKSETPAVALSKVDKPAPKPIKKVKAAPKTASPAPPPTPVKPHELSHGLSAGIDKRQAERFRGGRLPIERAASICMAVPSSRRMTISAPFSPTPMLGANAACS
jgi:DNA-nicking Smr family endonuclease